MNHQEINKSADKNPEQHALADLDFSEFADCKIERWPEAEPWVALRIIFPASETMGGGIAVEITPEALDQQILSADRRSLMFKALKKYRDQVKNTGEKTEQVGIGGNGAVLKLDDKTVIKESMTGHEAIRRRMRAQQKIEEAGASFPSDRIKLVTYFGCAHPIGINRFKEKTRSDIQEERIDSYLIMEKVGTGINLEQLNPDDRHEISDQADAIRERLIQMNELPPNSTNEDLKHYISEEFKKIEQSLEDNNIGLADLQEQNIVIDVSGDKPVFWIVDL